MSNHDTIIVAKCCAERACKKCGSIANTIVVKRGLHFTLFCENCGSYIKHASIDDKKHFYATRVNIQDSTPIKVCFLYKESKDTMLK